MASSDQEGFACHNRQSTSSDGRREKIRSLNDQFRRSLSGGRVLITSGVQGLKSDALWQVLAAVRQHDSFDDANDPYSEHDFGNFSWNSRQLLWKIDYYDLALEYGSPDPADEAVTSRVLTIMLASEY